MRPSESVVKNINRGFRDTFWFDDLHVEQPSRILAILDGVEQILHMVVWLCARKTKSSGRIESLDSTLLLQVPFDIDKTTIGFVECVRVDAISSNVTQRSWDTPLTEELHQSMNAFRIVDVIVPEHGVVWDIRPWVLFMASVHAWKLDRVSQEENWQVIEDEIVVALFCVELDRPSSYIADGIR